MPEETFIDDWWCDHCQADTKHRIYCAGHERDSSCDMWTCLTCGWWKTGMSDEQHEPIKD